ncbi:(deoxy)nucleoside triphosphate pyrophosphohydrolase [Bacillus mobilis]|uniref:(deoxy)nucleoside triphosphate pyrophosphohydrolase n=1 Tax=Bacillus mobilis TaxID=2026190 RepID=UPI000A301AEB|nr:(deoxy)nucleoside triphosphate pyrophosphohydrolase [Bacillus mobilis]MCU5594595.1 (deoxy)nucleoside triphosphate pyrophosphohydrolase [Bacillus mobilis]MCU5739657.1 (deoxy)nucleoside triphosphate pyrophosphohydrolase [Bacillus mobilis]MCU9559582.1 (deoxy)nucleoside triphosphate pyrophosphohydrolase [Bacillus mobilis]SME29190.1 CTP pyrophosphohydrolase [Bacillus mobilis]HDR7517006.1 (deoxy)nucleoside triphosphate pyrophosphohydrolase [Bacillus mobilis]
MKKKVSVVGAVIFNDNNEILCALRSPTMSLPNYWEFPGGKVHDGEDKREALIREIKEELDCTISVGKKIEEVEFEYENIIVHLITYKSRIELGTPKALEHAKIKWTSIKNLKALEWAPADMPTVEAL